MKKYNRVFVIVIDSMGIGNAPDAAAFGDTGADMLGEVRKHIDIYVDNQSHLITRIYMQNCPEYIVDELGDLGLENQAQCNGDGDEQPDLHQLHALVIPQDFLDSCS